MSGGRLCCCPEKTRPGSGQCRLSPRRTTDISGWGIEVAVGVQEGLPFDGVLRFAFPHPGFIPCTSLTTLSRDDLIEQAGAVSAAKLSEIDDALRTSEQRTEWTPAAVAMFSEIEGLPPPTDSGRPRSSGRAHQQRSVSSGRLNRVWPLSNKITIYGWSY